MSYILGRKLLPARTLFGGVWKRFERARLELSICPEFYFDGIISKNAKVKGSCPCDSRLNTCRHKYISVTGNTAIATVKTMPQPNIEEKSRPVRPNPTPVKQFYRRQLPDTCISFCSKEGQEIFKQAMMMGNMNCYFKLAAQFRTQDEPAFCGLSTLVMVLNALSIDPGKVWKGCWRWYHEDMLECCKPLDYVKQHGINLDQFVCLAYCNYLDVSSTRGDAFMTEEAFRETVRDMTTREDAYIVVSYSRATLSQTGDGHFSPIGGYHPEKDLVLILDTARFKYPPHWVSLKLLVEAMRKIDVSTGLPRGYMTVSRQRELLPLLIFRVSSALAATCENINEDMRSCMDQWNQWLLEPLDQKDILSNEQEKYRILGESVKQLLQLLHVLPENCCMLTTQIDMTCEGASCDHVCAICRLLHDIEATDLYKLIHNNANISYFKADLAKTGRLARWPKLPGDNQADCSQFNELTSSHFLTVLLLAWPYCKQEDTNGGSLELYTNHVLENSSDLVRNEMKNLRKQLATIFRLPLQVVNCD
eukprot:gene17793-19570_t